VAGLLVVLLSATAGLRNLPAQPEPGAAGSPAAPAAPVLSAAQPAPDANRNVVRQGFPAAKADAQDLTKSDTAWEIEWDLTSKDNNEQGKDPGSVLRIVSAKFMFKDRNKQAKWVKVAGNLQLAEAFSPYDDMQTAFLDVAKFDFATLPAVQDFLGPPCIVPGKILGSANPHFKDKVYREVHDDGLRWMTGSGPPNRARRGEKLLLWSVFQAGNYCYVLEYQFTDDGRIVSRMGFTGYNFYDRGVSRQGNRIPDGDVHLHIGCWRMDFDLGEPARNTYWLVRRLYDHQLNRFKVDREQVVVEGKRRWIAEELLTLRVESGTLTNAENRPVAYDLVPARIGSARDLKPTGQAAGLDMDFVNYDLWLTRTPPQRVPYHELPKLAGGRVLAGQPTTVWYSSPGMHVPRSEDFGAGGQKRDGVALTTWVEFTLRPRDLFDSTPLFEKIGAGKKGG